jgi:diguanylate cyclase (GGDEF)-like protein
VDVRLAAKREAGSSLGQHVSNLYTQMLLASLTERLPTATTQRLLEEAGITLGLDRTASFSTWSSYDQFRHVLEGVAAALPVPLSLADATVSTIKDLNVEICETITAFGSPSAVFASREGGNPLLPIRGTDTRRIAPNQWAVRNWFVEGFEPYPEFCDFTAGQYALIPVFFGCEAADVVEETCQCRGDEVCLFRVQWRQVDADRSRADYLEVHSQILEARLDQLHAMVTDLAANEHYEDILQGIVGSSMRAIGAPGAILVLRPHLGVPSRHFAEGLTEADATALADDLLTVGTGGRELLATAVASSRCDYGVLAVDERGAVFTGQSTATLETYSRLAAAALDSACALEDARHQANTSKVLLDLSTSLAQVVSTEEMAAKIARSVPALIDCDRAAVYLDQTGSDSADDDDGLRLVSSHGYSQEDLAVMKGQTFPTALVQLMIEDGLVQNNSDSEVGTLSTVSAPITSGGRLIGGIVVGVTSDAERLTVTPRLSDRLKGLAAQASISISNARLVDQIRYQALHDPLTGLPNRALILDRAEQMLARSRRGYAPVAALFIDLDSFKDVNDTFGHEAGDELLRAVAQRFGTAMREHDSIGRLGGDEFVVLVDGTSVESNPEVVAERLLDALREPFWLHEQMSEPLEVTASIGIAAGTRPSAAELLRDADIALYQAKSGGKNCATTFRPEMHAAIQDHHLLESDLRGALSKGQYFLVYQPIFNLATGQTKGVEALLRWRHPVRGVVQPDAFIPLLEESGMIIDVGRWVIAEACRRGNYWKALGHRLDISVNVSARQLDTDQFIVDLQETLDDSGFDPGSLVVEITETAIMRDVDSAIRRLGELKAMGVRIAIDDFGTGYSSLAYLRQFPVDTIKIDRSFVSSMSGSAASGALIHTLVQLGKSLGLETLAEGIETTEQYCQLERERCDLGQGYLFSRPLLAEVITDFLDHALEARRLPAIAQVAGDR